MDLSPFAVPHTLTHLVPMLPAPPARIIEAGCGRGALAAALSGLGFDVIGVDRDAEMVQATRRRGVRAVQADIVDLAETADLVGRFDVALFTRSLHHAPDLPAMLAHVARLLAPGGCIVIEEFAWERVDRAEARFLYDHRARLVRAGLLEAEGPAGGSLVEAWADAHRSLHRGSAMLDALGRVGPDVRVRPTAMLWRLVDGRGGVWTTSAARAGDELDAKRKQEERGIAAGELEPVGLFACLTGGAPDDGST